MLSAAELHALPARVPPHQRPGPAGLSPSLPLRAYMPTNLTHPRVVASHIHVSFRPPVVVSCRVCWACLRRRVWRPICWPLASSASPPHRCLFKHSNIQTFKRSNIPNHSNVQARTVSPTSQTFNPPSMVLKSLVPLNGCDVLLGAAVEQRPGPHPRLTHGTQPSPLPTQP